MIFILNPNLSTEAVENKINEWSKIAEKLDGGFEKITRLGKKTLAYEVKKQKQGYIVLIHVVGSHEVKDELERVCKISDDVIKFQTIKLNELQKQISLETIERIEFSGRRPIEDSEGKSESEDDEESSKDKPEDLAEKDDPETEKDDQKAE